MKNYPNGYDPHSEATDKGGPKTTHVVKDGWKRKSSKGVEIPCSLNGWVIARSSVNKDGKREIQGAMMRRLGNFSDAGIIAAINAGITADPKLLPDQIFFTFMSNAKRGADGRWTFPGMCDDAMVKFTDHDGKRTPVPWCTGDGEYAHRLQPDETRKRIVCNPVGKKGCAPKDFCPYSVVGTCKAKGWLIVMLLCPNAQTGHLEPLCRVSNATFKVETTSVPSMTQWIRAMIAAADLLDGELFEITGTISVNVTKTLNREGKAGIAPQSIMTISPHDIARKLARKRGAIETTINEPLAIEGPIAAPTEEAGAEEIEIEDVIETDEQEPEEEEATAPAAPSGGTLTRILRTSKRPNKKNAEKSDYGIQIEGDQWYNHFSATLHGKAEAAKASGKQVIIRTEPGGFPLTAIEDAPSGAQKVSGPLPSFPAPDPVDVAFGADDTIDAVIGAMNQEMTEIMALANMADADVVSWIRQKASKLTMSEWFAKINDEQFGPLVVKELRELCPRVSAVYKALCAADVIKSDPDEEWTK